MTIKNKIGWFIVVTFVCLWGYNVTSSYHTAKEQHDSMFDHADREWQDSDIIGKQSQIIGYSFDSDNKCDSLWTTRHWGLFSLISGILLAMAAGAGGFLGTIALISDVPTPEKLPKAVAKGV